MKTLLKGGTVVSAAGSRVADVLVDGEFVQAKHDISLRFRGSSNQRLLDVKKTLAAGQPVWWEDEKVFATHTMDAGGPHEL